MACADCASGHLHEGTPVGRTETLHNFPVYITDPPDGLRSRGIVVIVPDAFGWTLNNNRILADAYARRAYVTVYLPDFMNGFVLEPTLLSSMDDMVDSKSAYYSRFCSILRTVCHFGPHLYKNRLSVTLPRVTNFLKAVRSATTLPIGVAGFCWGGKHAVLLCNPSTQKADDGKPLIDCAFVAHPSDLKLPGDIEDVDLPLRICQGSADWVMGMDGVKTIQGIFKNKEEKLPKDKRDRYVISVVEGAKHGFAVRGNLGIQEEVKHGMIAEDAAVQWFQRWLGNE